MKAEIYAASTPQNGHQNEDHFFVSRNGFPTCAVADGAGAANQAAKRVLDMFARLHAEMEQTSPTGLLKPEVWKGWMKVLDSALMGGPQSTFCAFTIGGYMDSEQKRHEVAVGVCAGDTRFYLLNDNGELTNITASTRKMRLGSGSVDPVTFWVELHPGDLLLLLSDGAYTPMSLSELQRIAVKAKLIHLSEVPVAIIERAAKYGGLADDATVVALHYR